MELPSIRLVLEGRSFAETVGVRRGVEVEDREQGCMRLIGRNRDLRI